MNGKWPCYACLTSQCQWSWGLCNKNTHSRTACLSFSRMHFLSAVSLLTEDSNVPGNWKQIARGNFANGQFWQSPEMAVAKMLWPLDNCTWLFSPSNLYVSVYSRSLHIVFLIVKEAMKNKLSMICVMIYIPKVLLAASDDWTELISLSHSSLEKS